MRGGAGPADSSGCPVPPPRSPARPAGAPHSHTAGSTNTPGRLSRGEDARAAGHDEGQPVIVGIAPVSPGASPAVSPLLAVLPGWTAAPPERDAAHRPPPS